MKICHIINSLGNGGAEKNLIRISLDQIKKNKVTIITLKKKIFYNKILKKKKIKIISLDFNYNYKIFKNIILLLKILNDEKPDVFFSWMFHSCLLASFAAIINNIKLIWCIRHGSIVFGKTKILTIIIAKYILPILSSIPIKIIYNSNFSKKYYEKLGYNRNKTQVIFNGYYKNYFKPNKLFKAAFIKKYKIKSNQIIFGYVARFSPQKNHKFLFDCLNSLKKKKLSFKLILVGDNIKNNNNLKNLIRKFDLKKEIIIFKETKEINLIYPIFDLNFLVSSYGESFPNTLAESMLSGTPCITSDVGDSKYIIGKYGFLFNKNDKNDFMKNIFNFKKKFLKKKEFNILKHNCRERIISLFELNDKIKRYNKIIT